MYNGNKQVQTGEAGSSPPCHPSQRVPLPNPGRRLLVHVAERPVHRAQQVADLVRLLGHDAQVHGVVERLGPPAAHHAGAPLHLHHAVGVVLRLPDGPHAVDHGVVQPEGRLVGRDVEVAARVARHGEVADAVDAGAALHLVLERQDLRVPRDLLDDVRRLAVPRRQVVGDVAPDAPRVRAVPVGLRIPGGGRVGDGRHGSQIDGHAVGGSETSRLLGLPRRGSTIRDSWLTGFLLGHRRNSRMKEKEEEKKKKKREKEKKEKKKETKEKEKKKDVLLEGTRRDAPAAVARRLGGSESHAHTHPPTGARCGHLGTVPSQASIASVEDRRRERIVCPSAVVPVLAR
ncbi:hypothetical protein VTK73DRAFT_3646 [Phialemonium thermophilum]|uniref:Uncharacterized protein n=1 Tax=Phialemonium thermophilum TaxID=223376 RepID=A0ABR3VHQ0_9PEZI